MVESGALLNRVNADLEYQVKPYLMENAGATIDHFSNTTKLMDKTLQKIKQRKAKAHRDSILREMKRREDEIDAEKKRQIRIQQETIARRKRRAELREELRIDEL